MKRFEDCVCIAQARVIAGRKREPHICTIAYQPSADQFLRLCIPFKPGRSPLIKRWRTFSFEGTKEGLNNDTRSESWCMTKMLHRAREPVKDSYKRFLHGRILSAYRYESELNEQRDSIGLMVPIPDSLRLVRESLSPRRPDEAKELERCALLAGKGIWYPSFKIKISGRYMKDGERRPFNKQLIAWDVYEAERQIGQGESRDPYQAIYSYRNPYLIIGNLATQRNSWVVVGVLSAPDGAIERHAIHQQLSFA